MSFSGSLDFVFKLANQLSEYGFYDNIDHEHITEYRCRWTDFIDEQIIEKCNNLIHFQKPKDEKNSNINILDSILNKRPKLDLDKAVNKHISREQQA